MKHNLFLACTACAFLSFVSCETMTGPNSDKDSTDEITIYGNVIDRTTGMPLYNVMIQEANKSGGSTVTGNDGNYEFTLPVKSAPTVDDYDDWYYYEDGDYDSNTYHLIASKDKYSTAEYELKMSQVDKNRRVKVDFQLTKESITYTGSVVDSKNQPIFDAHISASYSRSGGNSFYDIGTTTMTDANGVYTMELPRPGTSSTTYDQWQYAITATKDGFASTSHVLNQNVDDMGKTITLNFILLSEEENQAQNEVTVTGKVTNSDGTALPNAYLMVEYYYSAAYYYVGSVMSDSDGQYMIRFIPQSSRRTYYFTMTHDDYSKRIKTLDLSSTDKGQTYTLDFTLTK